MCATTYKLPILLDKTLLDSGIRHYHSIDFASSPHIMTIGASGSGKTYMNKLIIAKTALYIADSQVHILDFKADDYHAQHGSNRLFEYDSCLKGLEQFYNGFQQRLEGIDASRNFKLLVIEELSSLLAYYDKKQVDSIKRMIASLVLMGRSYNFHCLISTQRPDASLFNAGVRDSIACIIALGSLSKESKSMIFTGYENDILPIYSTGSGYMLTKGADFHAIKVPLISNNDKLNQCINDALNR